MFDFYKDRTEKLEKENANLSADFYRLVDNVINISEEFNTLKETTDEAIKKQAIDNISTYLKVALLQSHIIIDKTTFNAGDPDHSTTVKTIKHNDTTIRSL